MKDLVLALYLPIVGLSLPALWLFATRLVLPGLADRNFQIDRYCIGLSAVFSLLAHAIENPYYWLIRVFPQEAGWLADTYAIVGLWKVLIIISCVFALAGLSQAITNRAQFGRLAVLALWLWLGGYLIMTIALR